MHLVVFLLNAFMEWIWQGILAEWQIAGTVLTEKQKKNSYQCKTKACFDLFLRKQRWLDSTWARHNYIWLYFKQIIWYFFHEPKNTHHQTSDNFILI